MKAALLISGYLRTFDTNFPNLKSKIIDKFKDIDIYMHITKDGNKNDKYLNKKNDEILKSLNAKCILYEEDFFMTEDYKLNSVLNSWFKFFKLNKIKTLNEDLNGKYDIVIKYRPDLSFMTDELFSEDISKDIIYLPKDSKIDKNKLSNIDDEYICDIFAYGNSSIMDKYFDVYSNLTNLIDKYHTKVSETLLVKYFKDFNLQYKQINIQYNVLLSLCNIFAIAGDSGSGKTTLGNILKKYFSSSFMLECDRYHKWERKDNNWNNYTHLNPEANYLAKMDEDIFDLKIGKTIYQVDYDHNTGKFTEPETINSSDNIIVCGLHSLYSNDENIYNMKIFIDTDDTLKYTWKINRDINKRGYTVQQVLNQIQSRKEDYIKYILPQRDISDIVINFFTDEKLNIDKLNLSPKIKLKLFVHKKYEFLNIILKFKEKNLKFDCKITNDSNFNQIIFDEYVEHDLPFNNNNYYDYIIYLILNLIKK